MPSPYTVTRHQEIDEILQALRNSHCTSVVGLSNTGKSTLLRNMRSTEVSARYTEYTGRQGAFIYIDCNGMLELSGQGLYEIILRSIREVLPDLDNGLNERLADHYRQLVEPDTQFQVPLSFNNAMTAVIENGHRDLILLLDEFDDPFDALDGRVFLNLRALKDKYPRNLVYVTATVRRLGSKRGDEATAEFVELSASHTFTLKPFLRSESDELAHALTEHASGPDLSAQELDFLWAQTGGLPRLLRAAVSHLVELHDASEYYQAEGLSLLETELLHDVTIRSECTRIWGQLGPDERDTLVAVVSGAAIEPAERSVQAAMEWGLLRDNNGVVEVASQILVDFVRRQATIQNNVPGGIWVDQDSGDVWVEGVPAPPLTELEFKLLSLLHERVNKLTDKYQIVETVWGVDYIDEVDDARIEKLVSRLRAKVEPDASVPRYLVTVRGRGYKMVS